MLATSKETNFTLTDKQAEAVDLISSDAMHILLYGGSRSTKTFTFVRSTVVRALAVPSSRHLFARFRFNSVKKSILLDTFPKVMRLCWPDLRWKQDNVDFYVTLPNGSEIWFGGLDDKERAEKILGNEYATILLNECSQISYSNRLLLITRLAQSCPYEIDGIVKHLRLKMFYDENPPSKGHWSHKLFIDKKDPITKLPLKDPENYASLLMNPADNKENLPKEYLNSLDQLPKRQRDRFYLGKFADDSENALWNEKIINDNRVDGVPDGVTIIRMVIPVDPSGASDNPEENNDDIGIGVMGLGSDGNAYVFEDLTINAGPAKWGAVAVSAYLRHDADKVVGETNFGGEMVKFVIQTAAAKEKVIVAFGKVTASRGKTVRAEPVSALHETGKIKFIGRFDELEDELLAFTTTGYSGNRSPNRADWFVWGVYELFPGMTSKPKSEINQAKPIPRAKRF